MAGTKKKPTLADDLMASLLKEVEDDKSADAPAFPFDEDSEPLNLNPLGFEKKSEKKSDGSTAHGVTKNGNSFLSGLDDHFDGQTSSEYEGTRIDEKTAEIVLTEIVDEESLLDLANTDEKTNIRPALAQPKAAPVQSLFDSDEVSQSDSEANNKIENLHTLHEAMNNEISSGEQKTHIYTEDETLAINQKIPAGQQQSHDTTAAIKRPPSYEFNASDKTVAVTGFHKKPVDDYEDKVKVSIGQSRAASSQGYAAWGGGGSDASLGQADNLRIAQEKILELEKENEILRHQNEELISASDIIKERSDLLTAQVNEYQNDKQDLEESFKNEAALFRGHLQRKEAELQKSQLKIDDLDSRLKFDMKKIRIRERELENRLELIRAEKNTLTKSKDDQILDLRRKMDVMQMEVESYRQKCVDLNKTLETNQDSFKRTTRALRLAMANLELQEENKPSLKKVD